MKLAQRIAMSTALTAAVTVGGATVLAAPASAATPTSASVKAPAATPAAAYNGVCGAGYSVIDSTPVGSVGTVYVTWNEATGKNCAVTIRNSPGTAIRVAVSLNVILDHESTPAVDSGIYTTYAGPVYYPARNLCIVWEGTIGANHVVDSGHCG